VIAYSDEEVLRDLIAGPSITACGIASREQAQGKIDTNCSAASVEMPAWVASRYGEGGVSDFSPSCSNAFATAGTPPQCCFFRIEVAILAAMELAELLSTFHHSLPP
jgi:hypothetical protein